MLHDIRLLLWLRIRHARTAFSRMMHLAGTDPVSEGGTGERVYQVYIAGFVAIALVALWAAMLDAVATSFAALSADGSIIVFRFALIALVAVFAATGVRGLRTAPLKCSHADIAYVISGGMRMQATVLASVVLRGVGCGIAGLVLGFALGTGLASGMQTGLDPMAASVFFAMGAAAAASAGWLVGAVRLACGCRFGAVAVEAVVVALGAVGCVALALYADPSVLLAGSGLAAGAFAFGSIALLGTAASTALAARFDRAIVIEESALFADTQPLASASLNFNIDPNLVRDYRRRKKLARRRVRFGLGRGSGHWALTSRAALSLLRQYDGWPTLIMQGTVAAPIGVVALSGTGGLSSIMVWLLALLLFGHGIREETRAFGDDMRIRLVRDRLPFGVLELLVFDTIPAFVVVTAVSLATIVPLAVYTGVPLVWALVLGVALNVLYVLMRGFDAVRFPLTGRCIEYEAGASVAAVCLMLVSFSGSFGVLAGAVVLACVVCAAIVHYGTECV